MGNDAGHGIAAVRLESHISGAFVNSNGLAYSSRTSCRTFGQHTAAVSGALVFQMAPPAAAVLPLIVAELLSTNRQLPGSAHPLQCCALRAKHDLSPTVAQDLFGMVFGNKLLPAEQGLVLHEALMQPEDLDTSPQGESMHGTVRHAEQGSRAILTS